jgi:hypothetical protein
MTNRRRLIAQDRGATAERSIPVELLWLRTEARFFWRVKANGNMFKARRLYALTALWYGYLHGFCVDDRTRFSEDSRTWLRCEPRPAKTWCSFHEDRSSASVCWSEADRSDREFAKRIAAELACGE